MTRSTRRVLACAAGLLTLVRTSTLVVAAGVTLYTYDECGELVRVQRPDGAVVTYTYDALGNRLTRTVVNDRDLDGVRDTLDCAPLDAGAWAIPGEAGALRVDADRETLRWDAVGGAGPAVVYDVVRGAAGEFPPGAGASETCVASGVAITAAPDAAAPAPGAAWWYAVRARNVCAAGTYGHASDGTERIIAACP